MPRDLDNEDEHYFASHAQPLTVKHPSLLEFETESATTDRVPDVEISTLLLKMQLRLRQTKGRIAAAKGRFDYSAQVQVHLPDRNQTGPTEILSMLCHNARVMRLMQLPLGIAALRQGPDVTSKSE